MTLKFKLPLTTALVILFSSAIFLGFTIVQLRNKARRDLDRHYSYRIDEANLSISRNIARLCSYIEALPSSLHRDSVREIATRQLQILEDADSSFAAWMCTVGTGLLIVRAPGRASTRSDSLRVIGYANTVARYRGKPMSSDPGTSVRGIRGEIPEFIGYAFLPNDSAVVMVMTRTFDDMRKRIAARSIEIHRELNRIIVDRTVFSLLLCLLMSGLAAGLSSMVTGPINSLVLFTNSIISGRISSSERVGGGSKDEIGQLAGSFNALLDKIEHTVSEAQENARAYRDLVESASSAILRLDADCVVRFANEYAERLFGYAPQELRGMRAVPALIPQILIDKAKTVAGHGFSASEHPQVNSYEEGLCRTRQGTSIWVAWTARAKLAGGSVTEILCVGSDITQQKRAQTEAEENRWRLLQTEKLATLGTLTAGIAHEINNPNNFILLNSQNLKEIMQEVVPILDSHFSRNPGLPLGGIPYSEMRSELLPIINGIDNGAQRIRTIVHHLKEYARIDSGERNERIDVNKTIEDALLIVGPQINKSTRRFTVAYNPKIPPVPGSPQRIEQVVINLVTNACEALRDPDEGISLTTGYDLVARRVLICLTDGGCGIPSEDLMRVTDPFFTTKRDAGGTGLGLSISKSIVQEHGGDLLIESRIGVGTTVTVTLPPADAA